MESRILRARTADLEAYNDRVAVSPNDCDVSVLATTAVQTTYPTAASSVYFLTTADLDGSDEEGDAATVVADGGEIFATNLGSGIPPVGTNVIASNVGGRWCFRWDS